MANKEKLLANAQKFLSKGQIPKAIGEYKKLVEAFPKDIRNRQKLAELFSRDKRNEDALTEYEAVAKHYTETGFYLKSIAVFKQMQKIEPSRVDIYHRLAELNEKQGLVGNALTEYRNLISFYEKNEMHSEAIEVLEKMAELDPENLNFSAKIAECLMAAGRNEEAFEKFQLIIEPMSNKGEHLKIVKLYERFLDVCPEEGTSRLPLAQSLLKSGSADKAIQILKGMIKHSLEDPDINQSLADAYVANQDFANARLTLKHLLKLKGDDLDLREYYARVCIDAGEVERARDRLEEWKDAFFQAERVAVLQGFYEELKELLPGDAVVSGTLSVLYEAVGDTAKLDELDVPEAVSAETDVTADVALDDGAIDDVETLDMVGEEVAADVDLPPLGDDQPAEKKSAEKSAAVGLELDLDLDLDFDAPETQAEAITPAADAEPEPIPEEDSSSVSEVDEDVEIEVEIDLDDLGDLDLDFDEEVASEETEIVAEQAIVDEQETDTEDEIVSEDETLEVELEIAPEQDDSEQLELHDDLETPSEEIEEVVVEEQELPQDDIELTFDDGDEDSLDVETAGETADDLQTDSEQFETLEFADAEELEAFDAVDEMADLPEDDELETLGSFEEPVALETVCEPSALAEIEDVELVEEAEELEFSEEVEEVEELEAIEEVEELEELEEIEELDEIEEVEELEALEEIEELEELEEVEELEEIEELETLEEVEVSEVIPPGVSDFASALNVDAELEEAEFYLQQGLYDDAERVVQTLMEYRPELPVLQAKMDEINQSRQAAETEAESTDFIDIMADLKDDDLLAATDFLDSFGAETEDDDELSQKLVSELDSADTESHYNLGIAYKEMGLYDDAIAEFEKASGDPVRGLDCITLTGQCHMEAGETEAAMAAFKGGLAHAGLTDEGRMTLNFEIGMLHQMNGQLLEALESFQLVAEKDSFFRDVSELIKALRRELGLDDDSNDDGGPQGNRDRVSYV